MFHVKQLEQFLCEFIKMSYPTAYDYSLNNFDFEDFLSWVADYESETYSNSIRRNYTPERIIKTLKNDPHRNPQWLLRKYLFMKYNVLDANKLL